MSIISIKREALGELIDKGLQLRKVPSNLGDWWGECVPCGVNSSLPPGGQAYGTENRDPERNEFWEGLGFQGMEIQIILDALRAAIAYYDAHQMSHKAQKARDLLQHISAPSPLKTTVFT